MSSTRRGFRALIFAESENRNGPAPILEEGDQILIADFVNTTGDDAFDGALRTALRVKLDESPYINIASGTAIRVIRSRGKSETGPRLK